MCRIRFDRKSGYTEAWEDWQRYGKVMIGTSKTARVKLVNSWVVLSYPASPSLQESPDRTSSYPTYLTDDTISTPHLKA